MFAVSAPSCRSRPPPPSSQSHRRPPAGTGCARGRIGRAARDERKHRPRRQAADNAAPGQVYPRGVLENLAVKFDPFSHLNLRCGVAQRVTISRQIAIWKAPSMRPNWAMKTEPAMNEGPAPIRPRRRRTGLPPARPSLRGKSVPRSSGDDRPRRYSPDSMPRSGHSGRCPARSALPRFSGRYRQ